MSVGRIACGLAVVAVLCVLGIFFFPVINGPGPYSAVHGPVTALLSIRAAVRLRTIIVQTGLDAIRGWFDYVGLALTTLSWSALAKTASKLDTLSAGFNRFFAADLPPHSLSNLFTSVRSRRSVCFAQSMSLRAATIELVFLPFQA